LNCPTQTFGLTSLPKCIDFTDVKGSHSANKKTKFWIQQRSKVATEGPLVWEHRTVRCNTGQCPVHHRTVSGAPEDSNLNSPPSGISRGTRAIIHRTVRCTPDSVRCTRGLQLELATFGNFQRHSRYNSPDCPVYTGQCPVHQEGAASGTRQLRENSNG
jgi:hypothetical protein